MSSDASQSILRLTLLACATAAFMVVWAGDSSRTVKMTLAERNRHVYPVHAVAGTMPAQLAKKPRMQPTAKVVASSMRLEAAGKVELKDSLQTLPGGSYRVVFEDGRVEWLTVIDRQGVARRSQPAVMTTIVNGERAHLIRVSARPASESMLR
jgi:hypothetical protein